ELENAAVRPGLRDVRADILRRERVRYPRHTRVDLRKPIAEETAGRVEHAAADAVRLLGVAVAPEAAGDDAVVVWPDRAVLVGERIIGCILRVQRADAPAAPHVVLHQPLHHTTGPLRQRNPRPEALPRIRSDRGDR